jgi:predicted dehydrogenase
MSDHRTRIVLLGEGAEADRWVRVFRPFARIGGSIEKLAGAAALVIAPGAGDPFGRAKEALQAGVPVLYAAPFALSPWQANVLVELSRRQSALLRFAEPFQHQPGFAFLRRLLQGDEPFWRPLYLRLLRTAPADGPRRIDELAAEELATCLALLGETPRSVTAAASRRDHVGEPCAVFVLMQQPEGPPVEATVSLAEPACTDQIVAVTAGHTVVVDDLHTAASLRITGESEAVPPVAQAPIDPLLAEARCFLQAVADRDASFANGERWAQAAALWWAARQSMSFGGTMRMPAMPRHTEPPPLTVIQGGGKSSSTKRERPPLTLVAS